MSAIQYHEAITYFTDEPKGPNNTPQHRLVFKTTGVQFQSALLADKSERTKNIWTQILMDRATRHLLGKPQLDGVYKIGDGIYQVT